jgi:hypothetical protein
MAKKQGSKVNQSIIKKIINEVSYVFDEDTHTYLYILKNVLLNNGMSNGTRTMLGDWVKKLPDRIEHYSILEEIKDDIRYRANQISGIMSIVWQDWSGLSDWQAYIKKEHIKNDVKNGFEYGVRLAESKKEAN